MYSREMFENRHQTSYLAATSMMKIVVNHFPNAKSIIDVGCGVGSFLRASKELGFESIKGIDGSWVDEDLLEFPVSDFLKVDLNKLPEANRKFDIALCLEVAEHLSPTSATSLVNFLVLQADVVVFSAAIPGQGGNNHVNEQWQSYWEEIFKSFGFVAEDLIRPQIWGEPNIPFWYQQNTVVYVKRSESMAPPRPRDWTIDIVHPEMLKIALESRITLKQSLRMLPKVLVGMLLPKTILRRR